MYDCILVTGGCGFMGSNFVRYVHTLHPQIKIVVLDALTYAGNVSTIADLLGDNVSFVHGNICDERIVDNVVSQCDAIVHFAAETHNDNAIANPEPFITTNVFGTYTLIQAARKYNVRFHHVSTDEVFGDMPAESTAMFNEHSPYKPSSPYSASKASADQLVRAWYRTYGLRATISNCSNNYGPYQHSEKFIPRQITNLIEHKLPILYGDGLDVRDWIHVEDHSSAVWEILTRGTIGETYCIGAHGERSNIAVLRTILTNMGAPIDVFERVPNRPGHDCRYAIDPTKIQQELGWHAQHTNFELGIQHTIRWYYDHQYWWKENKSF